MKHHLPPGKIPPALLQDILSDHPLRDPRVVLGPGVGLDCAVVDIGDRYLVMKSDPITFATDEIGWYAVQVNANDIATTGAKPKWFLVTLLLPENLTNETLVRQISRQLAAACEELDISLIGGHTEITLGLERPILAGTMIGEVSPAGLITPKGAAPGDRVMVTKSIPIEATAILAREAGEVWDSMLTAAELEQAAGYIHEPGIGITRDAQLAVQAGGVSAMHDPTEGGLAGALWELAEACGHTLKIDLQQAPVTELSAKISTALDLNPLGAIASGALLLCAPEADAEQIRQHLILNGVDCTDIGWIAAGPPEVQDVRGTDQSLVWRPERDEVARYFEA